MNVANNLLYVSASVGGEEWVERTSFRAQLKRWPREVEQMASRKREGKWLPAGHA
jgi:hypothetical protein